VKAIGAQGARALGAGAHGGAAAVDRAGGGGGAAGGDTDSARAAAATTSVGMVVALSALAMTFAALLLAYGIVRLQAPAWPLPGEIPLPRLWGWRITATLASLAGSVAMGTAATHAHRGGRQAVVTSLVVAAAAGLAFLALQAGSFRALGRAGIRPSSGLAASVAYALGLFHGLHALAALVAIVPAAAALARGTAPNASRIGALASFWHLVTVVWVVVFVAVFVA
jgi:cytochrome c oxidase subunit 3